MPQGLPSVSAEVLTKALSESGFLIEASVARRLRSAKWFVSQTRSYRDTETGKVREVDLVASKIYISRELPAELTVQLVLECKAVRAGLIALGRPLEKWHGMIPGFLCQGVPNAFYGGHTVMVGKRRFVRMWPAINFLDLAPVFPPTLMPAGCHQVLRIESHNPKKASLTSGLSDLLLPLAKATVQLAGTPPEVPLPVTEIPLLDSTRPDTAASKNEH